MHFRAADPDDPLLAKPFSEKKAFYAIRPPAGWKKAALSAGEKPLQYGVKFKDLKTPDFMTLGLLEGGPKDLSIESMSLFRGDYLGTVRKSGLGKVVGSDLFRFKHYTCLQVMARKGNNLALQLLIFDQPGQFLQLAFSVDQSRYHGLARALEACIASLEWPDFKAQ